MQEVRMVKDRKRFIP